MNAKGVTFRRAAFSSSGHGARSGADIDQTVARFRPGSSGCDQTTSLSHWSQSSASSDADSSGQPSFGPASASDTSLEGGSSTNDLQQTQEATPRSGMQPFPPGPKRHASPETWQRHKAEIKRLYLDEDKTLSQVMDIMYREHGHYGSEKMYKSRFTKWGFDQKHRKHKMVNTRKPKQPKQDTRLSGVQSHARQHGKGPKLEEGLCTTEEHPTVQCLAVQRPARPGRRAKVMKRDHEAGHRNGLHSGILLQQLLMGCDHPGRFAPNSVAENMCPLVYTHVGISIPKHAFRFDNFGSFVDHEHTEQMREALRAFYSSFYCAMMLFEQEKPAKAGPHVQTAFELLSVFLEGGGVRGLSAICFNLLRLIQYGHVQIAIVMVRYIQQMAETRLKPSHPVASLFRYLQQVDVVQLQEHVQLMWRVLFDALGTSVPALPLETIYDDCGITKRLEGDSDLGIYEELEAEPPKICNATNTATFGFDQLSILEHVGWSALYQEKWAEAAVIGQELVRRGQRSLDPSAPSYQISGHRMLAHGYHRRGVITTGVECLKTASALMAVEWGENHPCRSEVLLLQDVWLRGGGHVDVPGPTDSVVEVSTN